MAETAIEWATHVWNPVTGCDRVSPGCAHCYALTYAGRLKAMGQAKYQRDGGKASGPGFGVTLHERELAAPARWRRPRRVFVNSMSDLFHEEVPASFIAEVFGVMARAPRHDFLVLTKRAGRMCEVVTEIEREHPGLVASRGWPVPNVWLGVSIENRRFVHRADLLRETPAAVRFISAEPLLGPLVHDAGGWTIPRGGNWTPQEGGDPPDWEAGWSDDYEGPELDLTGIDWLIIGGESGSGHRRFDPQWARDLRDAARDAGTACFMKQMGGHRPGSKLEDLPEDLRIRELPTARQAVPA